MGKNTYLFRLIEASNLSCEDAFMQHKPKTPNEEKFKEYISQAIANGLNDFYHPICDASFDDNDGICFAPGNRPAVGKSYAWWNKVAKEFCPERGSRLGTKKEYMVFLAWIMKRLVDSKMPVEEVWEYFCNNSTRLAHFSNSSFAKSTFEPTGSRTLLGFFDFANTYKILADDEEPASFWMATGSYVNMGYCFTLTLAYQHFSKDNVHKFGTGWLVLEK